MFIKNFSNRVEENDSNNIAVGELRFDLKRNLLMRNGEALAVPPKLLRILSALAQQPGEIVEKRKLIESVWPDTIVEEATLTQHVFMLRKFVGPDAIETVPKRGYRLVSAEVPRPEPQPLASRRRWYLAAAGSLAAVCGAAWVGVKNLPASRRRAESMEYFVRGREMLRAGGVASTAIFPPTAAAGAMTLFEKARSTDPALPDVHAWIALVQVGEYNSGRAAKPVLESAKASASLALSLDPNLAEAHRALIGIAHATDRLEAALAQAWKLLRTGKRDAPALEAAADAYFRAGLIPESLSLRECVLPLQPLNIDSRVALARSQFHALRHRDGIATLSPVCDNEFAKWLLGQMYEQVEEPSKAVEFAVSHLLNAPASQAGLYEAARIASWAKQLPAARTAIDKGLRQIAALTALHRNPRSLIFAALTQAELRQIDVARDLVRQASEIVTDSAWVTYHAALVYATIRDGASLTMLQRAYDAGWIGTHYLTRDESPHRPFEHLTRVSAYAKLHDAFFARTEALRKRFPLPAI